MKITYSTAVTKKTEKDVQFVEGATTAGMKVIAPNRDDGNVLLLSDDEVVDDVHHILDSSTDV